MFVGPVLTVTCFPFPFREATRGATEGPWDTLSVPVACPSIVGTNDTLISILAPAGNVKGVAGSAEIKNDGLSTETPVIVAVSVPALCNVIVPGLLMSPRATSPRSRLEAERVSCGAVSTPVACKATSNVPGAALLTTNRLPVTSPKLAGTNIKPSVTVCPGDNVKGNPGEDARRIWETSMLSPLTVVFT